MTGCDLRIAFSSYWHCGSGRSEAAAIDAKVVRDALGLPFVPGRTLKGLLRDAVRQAVVLGHVDPAWEGTLFGSAARSDIETSDLVPIEGTDPGVLLVGSGRVPHAVLDWFRSAAPEEVGSLVPNLFAVLSQTAIEQESGAAADHSLRSIEVALPMHLTAHLTLRPAHADSGGLSDETVAGEWISILKTALPLVDGIGAHRTRGLGRCTLTLEETPT